MKITVERFNDDGEATLSLVRIDGEFQCFGLEDQKQEFKVAGETRIPSGTYNIGVRDVGGFHNRYSKKFPSFHDGMLQVLDVPNFEYILIHIGNTDDHTAGCLLIGDGANCNGTIQSSTSAYKKFYSKVIDEAKLGHVTIEYINCERG